MRIVGEQNGSYVVQYSLKDAPESVYDFKNQIVFVKKSVTIDGTDGYLYAQYDATQLSHNGSGFVINDQKPSKTKMCIRDRVMNSGSLITRQPHDGKIKVFANDLMKRPSRNGRFLFICKNSWKSVFIVIADVYKRPDYVCRCLIEPKTP